MSKYPDKRQNDLILRQMEDELLVYDLKRDKALCLNATAAMVWHSCDGHSSVLSITRKLQKQLKSPVDEQVVWYAINQLSRDHLLQEQWTLPAEFAGLNRRGVIRALGLAAATVAVPLVTSIVAPSAQAQASCIGAGGRCPGALPCCAPLGCIGNTCTEGCVVPETLITAANGKLIPAKSVLVGQALLGVDTVTGRVVSANVKEIFHERAPRSYEFRTTSGEVLRCSPTHPIIAGYGDRKSLRAADLKIGDKVLVYDGAMERANESSVTSMKLSNKEQPVLIYEMNSKEHTFISGGIVSHNAQRQSGYGGQPDRAKD